MCFRGAWWKGRPAIDLEKCSVRRWPLHFFMVNVDGTFHDQNGTFHDLFGFIFYHAIGHEKCSWRRPLHFSLVDVNHCTFLLHVSLVDVDHPALFYLVYGRCSSTSIIQPFSSRPCWRQTQLLPTFRGRKHLRTNKK